MQLLDTINGPVWQVVATVTAMVVSLDQQYRPRRIGTELQRRLLRGEAHTKAGVAVNILD